MLQQLGEGLWTAAALQSFMGLHLGTRMSVVRLEDGGLWVYSPVPLRAELKAQLDAIGEVTDIVAPNVGHHLYAKQYKDAYPNASVHAASGVEKRNKELVADYTLSSAVPERWGEELQTVHVEGTMLNESVYLHKRTQSLLCVDLVENFKTSNHSPTRFYLKLAGIHGKPGVSKMLRPMFCDREKSRTAVDRVLQWDFDKVVLAHGEILEQNARAELRKAYEWLKA